MSSLETLAWVGRHLHPPDLPALARSLAEVDQLLGAARAQFEGASWPESLIDFRNRVLTATDAALRAINGLSRRRLHLPMKKLIPEQLRQNV